MKIETCKPHRLPLKKLDWGSLVPLIGGAREALARYDETLLHTPPHLLEIFKWNESISSLKSQNISADLKEVLQFSIEKRATEARIPLLQKILNTKEGLDFAIQWAQKKPLNLSFFCRVHAIVKKDALNPQEIGRIRKKQNWIGPQGGSIEEAYFFPPEAKKVLRYMHSLNKYWHLKEKDPLVQVAIFFAQFLIIHPFMDGNGRVARIFIPVALWKKGFISKPMLFLSGYFERNRLNYFRNLFYVSDKNAWENWIAYFLKGVIEESHRLKKEAEQRKTPPNLRVR